MQKPCYACILLTALIDDRRGICPSLGAFTIALLSSFRVLFLSCFLASLKLTILSVLWTNLQILPGASVSACASQSGSTNEVSGFCFTTPLCDLYVSNVPSPCVNHSHTPRGLHIKNPQPWTDTHTTLRNRWVGRTLLRITMRLYTISKNLLQDQTPHPQ